MKTFLIFLLLIPTTLWSCNKAEQTVTEESKPAEKPVESLLPAHLKSSYQLVWNDEFDGTTVNTAKWNFRGEGTVRNYATVSQ